MFNGKIDFIQTIKEQGSLVKEKCKYGWDRFYLIQELAPLWVFLAVLEIFKLLGYVDFSNGGFSKNIQGVLVVIAITYLERSFFGQKKIIETLQKKINQKIEIIQELEKKIHAPILKAKQRNLINKEKCKSSYFYQIRKKDDLEQKKSMFEDFCFSFLIHQGYSIREIPHQSKAQYKNADFVAIKVQDNVRINYLVKCEWDDNYPINESNNQVKMNNHLTQSIAVLGTIISLENSFNHILLTNADAQEYHKELAKNYQINLFDFNKIQEIGNNKE